MKKILTSFIISLTSVLVFAAPAFAASGDVTKVEDFIRSVIQLGAGLSGLVAAGFLVFGGFHYISSSGNPLQLDKAKSTIKYALLGLVIVIAAFILSSIVADLATSAFGGK